MNFSPLDSRWLCRHLRPLVRSVVAMGGLALTAIGAAPVEVQEVKPLPAVPVGTASTDTRADITLADLNLSLIWVGPGTFTMGSPPDEQNRHPSEGPPVKVTLTKGFWLGKTEVTQAQYTAITGSNPSYFKAVGQDAPVEEVSWIEAAEYCRKLTERERAAGRLPEGYAYSLPTEAQWEYAYRAGTSGFYPGTPDEMAWTVENSGGTTHPVARKRPNAWGFYDMGGNVLEWCADWFADYPRGAVTDPAGPRTGYFRMARGGSWRVPSRVTRSAARAGGSAGRHDYTLGFRIALTALP